MTAAKKSPSVCGILALSLSAIAAALLFWVTVWPDQISQFDPPWVTLILGVIGFLTVCSVALDVIAIVGGGPNRVSGIVGCVLILLPVINVIGVLVLVGRGLGYN